MDRCRVVVWVALRKFAAVIALGAAVGWAAPPMQCLTAWGGSVSMAPATALAILCCVMLMRCPNRDRAALWLSLFVLGLVIAALLRFEEIIGFDYWWYGRMAESTSIILSLLIAAAWIPRPHSFLLAFSGASLCLAIIGIELLSPDHLGTNDMSWPTMAALTSLVLSQYLRGRDRRVTAYHRDFERRRLTS